MVESASELKIGDASESQQLLSNGSGAPAQSGTNFAMILLEGDVRLVRLMLWHGIGPATETGP